MNYVGNIQLFIPSAGSFSVFILAILYIVIYLRFREKIYLAGALMTVLVGFFILFEALCIKAGLQDNPVLGRQFNRGEHIFAAFFFFTLPFLLYQCSNTGKIWHKILKVMFFAGLGIAVFLTFISLFFPDLYVSVTQPSAMASILKGNAGKGKQGPLYIVRDVLIFAYVLFSFIYTGVLIFRYKETNIIPIFTGILIAILGAADDCLYIFLQKKIIFPQYHFSRFCAGMIIMLICFFMGILSDFVRTQKNLQKADEKIKLSEIKYRILSEGVSSAIFSLSENLTFLSGNERAVQYFALQNGLGKKNFFEILNKRNPRSRVVNDLIMDKFKELKESRQEIAFHASIIDPRTGEPLEYQFNFRYFEGGQLEFIGEAFPRAGIGLVDYIDYERIQISIFNYIVLLDDVTARLSGALAKYLDRGEVMMIKMGLQEVLMNAIEHGNLNITFQEKTRAQEEDRYIEFIRERQNDPQYKERKVSIDYMLTDKKVQYKISDEGDGFDYSHIMKMVNENHKNNDLFHGRGILMALSVFDTVKYNAKGNQVLLEKYF